MRSKMLKILYSYPTGLIPRTNLNGQLPGLLREAVTTFEEVERIARQVLGGSHPYTVKIEHALAGARAALRARETPSASA